MGEKRERRDATIKPLNHNNQSYEASLLYTQLLTFNCCNFILSLVIYYESIGVSRNGFVNAEKCMNLHNYF